MKRARDPVKSRTVNGDILTKYRSKLGKLEDDVKLVIEEEKADKELAKCENRAGKLQNQLAGEEDRAWFQTKQQRKDEKQALKKKLKDPTFTKQKQKKKAEVNITDPVEAREMKQMNNEADYVARGAKRARKLKKIRSVIDDSENAGPGKAKKQKKKSSFDSELTNTSDKSVKGFRHIANKQKNDDRRMSKKKPRGGGGGKNKGGGGMNKEQRKNTKKSSFK